MPYDPFKHHRRSIRLKGYDYSQEGACFVTICVKNGEPILGEIIDGAMRLNNWGQIVDFEWRLTEHLRRNVILDEYQVMPNHFHGIFWILNKHVENFQVSSKRILLQHPFRKIHKHLPTTFGRPPKGSLGVIVGGFKSAVTAAVNDLEETPGASFWQRGYYDQIIRNERHLQNVRRYIKNNPANWKKDCLHPRQPTNKFNEVWRKRVD